MKRSPIAFVIKEQVVRGITGPTVVDYSPALEFGDLEFITRHDLPNYPNSSVQEVWDADVASFVDRYDETLDYIIPTGQPMAILAVGWAMGRAGKIPRFLSWKAQEGKYRVMNFYANKIHGGSIV